MLNVAVKKKLLPSNPCATVEFPVSLKGCWNLKKWNDPYPPMQKGASFNLDAVKEKIADALKAQQQ
jgi:hypothetical protein